MALPFDQVLPVAAIPELEEAGLWRDLRGRPMTQEWEGVTYEVRNHIAGPITVTRSAEPTAILYPLSLEAEYAYNRGPAEAVFSAAGTKAGWDDNNRAAVASGQNGTRWAAAWFNNGVPGFAEHDTWDDALRTMAQQLDSMADGHVITGDNITARIASAHLRRSANQVRDLLLTAELGDAVRVAKAWMQEERMVSQIASGLAVNRRFVYRVFEGTEWRRP
ncbi:hypothetical protein [Streptomyces sp. RKAG337]|uniref:hypothetical protein n=1 Tax=Streptomyces sp. RKAG337 TaxID=2893404 RepID=UPI002034459D|nr:hypothetical protein [Streptomyces sp. RKAG337]MCM2430987.1 hypothetical protein [Streptomyces sp. RKAG337]